MLFFIINNMFIFNSVIRIILEQLETNPIIKKMSEKFSSNRSESAFQGAQGAI